MQAARALSAPTSCRSGPLQLAHAGRQQQRRLAAAAAPARSRGQQRQRSVTIRAAQKQAFKSFEDMIHRSSEPVLVDFYATWCGPCQMQSQVLDSVAPEMRGRVRFVKIDTERYPGIASQYAVGALPTLILFKNGQPVDRVEGALMADQLRQRLQYFLADQPQQKQQ